MYSASLIQRTSKDIYMQDTVVQKDFSPCLGLVFLLYVSAQIDSWCITALYSMKKNSNNRICIDVKWRI